MHLQKVSTHVSLRRMRRLTWVDTFCNWINFCMSIGCWLYWGLTPHIIAVGDTRVFPGFLTPVLTQLSFQSNRLLFSQASTEVRGENKHENKFASIRYRTHNRQDMSPTSSPLSHPGGDSTCQGSSVRYNLASC